MNVIHGAPPPRILTASQEVTRVIQGTRPKGKPLKGAELRAERRELMIDTVVERATELLEHGGLEVLTLARVAESLGYTTTAVYRYFASKDALVAAMQRKAIGEIHIVFRHELYVRARALEGGAAPTLALALLLSAADFYLRLPETRPREWLLVAVLLGDPRPLVSDDESSRAEDGLGSFLGGVDSLFHDAVDVGALEKGDARERTLALWSAVHGALALEKARRIVPSIPPASSIAAPVVRALLLSWGATGARITAAERAQSKGK